MLETGESGRLSGRMLNFAWSRGIGQKLEGVCGFRATLLCNSLTQLVTVLTISRAVSRGEFAFRSARLLTLYLALFDNLDCFLS